MMFQAPAFWWTKKSWQAWLLTPFSALYGIVARQRMRGKQRFEISVPVMCVGNFTAGGAGKTPTALALAKAAKAKGLNPGFLSRGYGGSVQGALQVQPDVHTAADVGDEPLLLAREAITVVSRRRPEGSRLLKTLGVDLIIMDDGFQSAALVHDYALIVIDQKRGIGNGEVFPSGPLRAPLQTQLDHATALLLVGSGKAADHLGTLIERAQLPVFEAALQPTGFEDGFKRQLLAFAGIADPSKFFHTVESLGGNIALRRSFADHAPLSEQAMTALLEEAQAKNLQLVTTAKDFVRLSGRPGMAQTLQQACLVVEVEMHFADASTPGAMIEQTCQNYRARAQAHTS